MQIQWSKDLETGNALIDSEHKTLVEKVNILMDACAKGAGRSKVGESADFLWSYVKTHFSHEEALQAKYNFPQIEAHKAWHRNYAKGVEGMLQQLKSEEQVSITSVALINKEVGVLLSHIKSMDVALARYLHEKA